MHLQRLLLQLNIESASPFRSRRRSTGRASGTASDSGSCTTTSQLGSTGWTTTGSGSTSSSSTKSYSYSGAGTLTVATANTNYSNAYGSMTDVRQNVANENGSGSITEKHAMGWSLASGATQWSGTDTGDLSKRHVDGHLRLRRIRAVLVRVGAGQPVVGRQFLANMVRSPDA